MKKLTDLQAKRMQRDGSPIADGTVPGLRLHPGGVAGHGKWIMRFTSPVTGKRREIGFGVYPEVSLVEARDKATEARQLIRDGLDPVDERRASTAAAKANAVALTFEDAALQAYADKKDGWRNAKHGEQWIQTLRTYAFPKIGTRKVQDLKAGDFADTLRPIWLSKAETASRVKQRCDTVMDWCIAHGHITANPVKSASSLLPKQPSARERAVRYPSMHWKDVPAFVTNTLQTDTPSLSAVMLEFLILTAARSGEVRGMTWAEVDFDAAVWTVPAERMKARVEHKVPLSTRALEILRSQHESRQSPELVFPSVRGKVTTDMILTKFLRDKKVPSDTLGRTATAHGFRSSFRDWASENGYSQEAAERALAHTIRNSTEWSYHRTALLDQRRVMMQAWSDFVSQTAPAAVNITPLRHAS